MLILGIESSCDDTGVAIYDAQLGLLSHMVSTQQVHAQFGGVIPELAAREQLKAIIPMLSIMVTPDGYLRSDGEKQTARPLEAIAYTAGPGLMGSLCVGAMVARTLGALWKLPVLPINHIEGHIFSAFLTLDPTQKYSDFMPLVALIASGGHTQLFYIPQIGHYQLLGETLDDAAGEAFDKAASCLGLPYPGGAALSHLAQQGGPSAYTLPIPLKNSKDLHFSFSGLKTAFAKLCKNAHTRQDQANLAWCFERTVVESLCQTSLRALKQVGTKNFLLAGGVSANLTLRHALGAALSTLGGKFLYPSIALSGDNAAMIACVGSWRHQNPEKSEARPEFVDPAWKLD